MLFAERFLSNAIVEVYDQHPILASDDVGTWYTQSCQFLKINYHIHSAILHIPLFFGGA